MFFTNSVYPLRFFFFCLVQYCFAAENNIKTVLFLTISEPSSIESTQPNLSSASNSQLYSIVKTISQLNQQLTIATPS